MGKPIFSFARGTKRAFKRPLNSSLPEFSGQLHQVFDMHEDKDAYSKQDVLKLISLANILGLGDATLRQVLIFFHSLMCINEADDFADNIFYCNFGDDCKTLDINNTVNFYIAG